MACSTIQQQPESTVTPTEEPTAAPTMAATEVLVQEKQMKATKTIVIVEQPPVEMEENECSELGCPLGTALIGDAKTDLYYECKCTFVKWIKPVHLLCFDSEEEAMERGYRKAESC